MNMMIPATSSNSSLDFFRQFFVGADTGLVVLWLKPRNGRTETYSFPATDLEAVAKANVELADRGDVYFERSLQGVAPSRGRRGSEAGVVQTFSLSIDLDTGEGPHSTPPERLPRDLDEALALIREAGLPEPTLVLHTGGGVHLHWLYTTPFTITNDADRAAEKALAEAWQTRLTPVFKVRDYAVDRTFSLEHLFRAPGTMNRKVDEANPSRPAQPVKLMSVGPRLDRAVALASVELKATRVGGKVKPGGASALLRERGRQAHIARAKPDNLASVLAGCAWMKHCEDDAATLTEPEWYPMLTVSGRCEGGRELSHKLSEPHPGYNEAETDDKLHHALNDTGPVKCKTVANELGFEGCARCPFRASITSPMQLAPEPVNLVRVQREAVYVEKGRTYFDLRSGEKLDTQEFGDGVRAKVGPHPHDKLMASYTMPKVKRRDYRPGNPNLILREADGTKAVNIWQQGGITPVKGDPKPILDYFDRLIPVEADRRFLLQFLAHLYRHPEVKIEFGAIIVGGYGTGKSTFHSRIVSRLFGEGNARKLEGAELASPYNARWVDCQVLMIEEAHHGERLEVFKSTLELLVAEHINVHDKYIRSFQGRTPRGITMVSNDEAPIVLPPGDRRWFLAATLPTPETEEEKQEHRAFFKRLYEVLNQDDTALAAFAYHLQHEVSLEGFEPKGEPPMTAAKETATKASRTPVAQVLGELIEAGLPPFHKDIVEMKEVIHALKMSDYAHTLDRITPQKVASVIRAVGGKQMNMDGGQHLELVISKTVKPRPWAIRMTGHWAKASREEMKAEFLRIPGDAGDNVAHLKDAALRRMMEEAARRSS